MIYKRIIMGILFCFMLSFCACGASIDKEYVEVSVNLVDCADYVSDIVKTEDGRLEIAGTNEDLSQAGIWESEDGGNTWKKTSKSVARSMSEENLGSGSKTEYLSCIRLSTAERSRDQNSSRICHVEGVKEETASG